VLSDSVPKSLRGQCLCGAVCFEVEDAFAYACYCHCTRCRRRTGSAFTAFGGIERDKLRISSGADDLLKLGPNDEAYNAFCRKCLSPLFAAIPGPTRMHVQLGALTDAPSRHPDHHIMVAFKAPWYQITDALPQWAEFPTG
jgi:hypothetical protein